MKIINETVAVDGTIIITIIEAHHEEVEDLVEEEEEEDKIDITTINKIVTTVSHIDLPIKEENMIVICMDMMVDLIRMAHLQLLLLLHTMEIIQEVIEDILVADQDTTMTMEMIKHTKKMTMIEKGKTMLDLGRSPRLKIQRRIRHPLLVTFCSSQSRNK
jgi:hypothetical protein